VIWPVSKEPFLGKPICELAIYQHGKGTRAQSTATLLGVPRWPKGWPRGPKEKAER